MATLQLSVDNVYKVYLDGNLVGEGSNWYSPDLYDLNLSQGNHVIAIEATDQGGPAAAIAGLKLGGSSLYTSSAWKIATTASSGWNQTGFDDSQWAYATEYSGAKESPWASQGFNRSNLITPDAKWIWTRNLETDDKAFIRTSFSVSADGTIVAQTKPAPDPTNSQLQLSVDNFYKVYLDGNLVGEGSNWYSPDLYDLNLSQGNHVIAIEATDQGGPAAAIAGLKLGSSSLYTSSVWKIATTASSGWNQTGFDDSQWAYATEYSGLNELPWASQGFNPSNLITPDAKWIWTNDLEDDNQSFIRLSFAVNETGNISVAEQPNTVNSYSVLYSNTTGGILEGTQRDDYLIGGEGNDFMNSGQGNDVVYAGNGDDVVYSGDGNDLIIGGDGAGNDNYDGGMGSDTIKYMSAKAAISVDLKIGSVTSTAGNNSAGIGNDVLLSIENIIAGNYNDTIKGNSSDNTLDGGAGADNMAGGAGNDTYTVDTAADTVTEVAAQGTDNVRTSVSYTLGANLETLTLTGTAANGTGNAAANALTGNASDNTLDGAAGADAMAGGAGNDTYIVDTAADTVTEVAAQGTDTVRASVSYTLGTNLENLTLTGTAAINGTGNAAANSLTGNSANNVLDGKDGRDSLTGQAGADTFLFSTKPTLGLTTADHITDFTSTQGDKTQISRAAFGITSNATASLTTINTATALTKALSSSSLFVYDSRDGSLYWNQNGSTAGFGTGGIFAVLDNRASLTATNISLI